MSCPATTGSAASATTGVNEPPSWAATLSSAARSRATPATATPAPASAAAMARPNPRLAPVTTAVRPVMSVPVRSGLVTSGLVMNCLPEPAAAPCGPLPR